MTKEISDGSTLYVLLKRRMKHLFYTKLSKTTFLFLNLLVYYYSFSSVMSKSSWFFLWVLFTVSDSKDIFVHSDTFMNTSMQVLLPALYHLLRSWRNKMWKKTRLIPKSVELQALASGGLTTTCDSKTNISNVLEQTCPNDQTSVQIIAFIVVSHQHCECVSQTCCIRNCILQAMCFCTTAFCQINIRSLSQPTKTVISAV